jgi:hypothetical protein
MACTKSCASPFALPVLPKFSREDIEATVSDCAARVMRSSMAPTIRVALVTSRWVEAGRAPSAIVARPAAFSDTAVASALPASELKPGSLPDFAASASQAE